MQLQLSYAKCVASRYRGAFWEKVLDVRSAPSGDMIKVEPRAPNSLLPLEFPHIK